MTELSGPPKTPYAPDEVVPEGKWEFDGEVAQVFDDMLARSIPQYDLMRRTVTDLALEALPDGVSNKHIADLGASRGEALAPIVRNRGSHAVYHAVETAEAMVEQLRERQAGEEWSGYDVRVYDHDLRRGLPEKLPQCRVILCVLTLQFTPIEYRQQILHEIFRRLMPGGRLVLVEKILGDTAEIDETFKGHYYALKGKNGYSPEQIERKRLSLEGVLVPVTPWMNEEMLRGAGFRSVGRFWQWMNFAGWVAIR
jgi:tRNA (cmo5U34)-methyltransferase